MAPAKPTLLNAAAKQKGERRFALLIEYDGTDFVGWQVQSNGRSVQAVIESSIHEVLGRKARIVGSGRTDSGVHALGQVAHFDVHHNIPAERLTEALNSRLPADVQIRAAREVGARGHAGEFHARRDARLRRYVYLLADGSSKPCLDRRRVSWTPYSLDAARMEMAAQAWIGKHDFTSFRAQRCQAESPIRSIDRFTVERSKGGGGTSAIGAGIAPILIFAVEARSFLHHQVRNMVGTLVEIGRGAETPEWAAAVLTARDRSTAGVTMSAEGLTFERVDYREALWD